LNERNKAIKEKQGKVPEPETKEFKINDQIS